MGGGGEGGRGGRGGGALGVLTCQFPPAQRGEYRCVFTHVVGRGGV